MDCPLSIPAVSAATRSWQPVVPEETGCYAARSGPCFLAAHDNVEATLAANRTRGGFNPIRRRMRRTLGFTAARTTISPRARALPAKLARAAAPVESIIG